MALGGGVPSNPPSVIIRSPKDKGLAVRELATKGHLEFGEFFSFRWNARRMTRRGSPYPPSRGIQHSTSPPSTPLGLNSYFPGLFFLFFSLSLSRSSLPATSSRTASLLPIAQDVDGLVSTHVDVNVATVVPGELTVKIYSPLIPELPFKNSANAPTSPPGGSGGGRGEALVPKSPPRGIVKGGKASDWDSVTNLGTGNTYYVNAKTGEKRYADPR